MDEQDMKLAKKHAIYVTAEDGYTEVLVDDLIFCQEAFADFLDERDAIIWAKNNGVLPQHEPSCQPPIEADKVLELIADDQFASSFQSLGQYRKALIEAIKGE